MHQKAERYSNVVHYTQILYYDSPVRVPSSPSSALATILFHSNDHRITIWFHRQKHYGCCNCSWMRGDQADEIHTITRISVIHGCAHAHYCIYRLFVYKSYNYTHFHEDPYSNSDH